MGHIARAFREEGRSADLIQAQGIKEANAERDVHRMCVRAGLSLPVPISTLLIPKTDPFEEDVVLSHLRITDYFKVLLGKYPELLLGGLPLGTKAEARCGAFWEHFSKVQPDHEVFRQFGAESRKRCVPVCIHGDKGRTLKKSAIMCVSFESAFGLPPEQRETSKQRAHAKKQKIQPDGRLNMSCEARMKFCDPPETLKCFPADADCLGHCMVKQQAECPSALEAEPCNQLHNSKGHSFLSRFLLYNITHSVFKKNSDTIPAALREVSQELRCRISR